MSPVLNFGTHFFLKLLNIFATQFLVIFRFVELVGALVNKLPESFL